MQGFPYKMSTLRMFLGRTSNLDSIKTVSKSQKLLQECGYIDSQSSGFVSLLPFMVRSLEKVTVLIDHLMEKIHAQKVILPSICTSDLWKLTGRLNSSIHELFTLCDQRSRQHILCPITSKFRDEKRPKSGLLRTREFIMKDLYSFDSSKDTSLVTYNAVCAAYDEMFRSLGVQFAKDAGENELLVCSKCGISNNMDSSKILCGHEASLPAESCSHCSVHKGIEVCHAFLLGTHYSQKMEAHFLNFEGNLECMQMGCFGIGVTRLLAALVEILSTDSAIRWPQSLAPFSACIVTPKAGSKEENQGRMVLKKLCDRLHHLRSDIVIDDREQLTIGRRLLDINKLGVPYSIIIGKAAAHDPDSLELIHNYTNEHTITSMDEICERIVSLCSSI